MGEYLVIFFCFGRDSFTVFIFLYKKVGTLNNLCDLIFKNLSIFWGGGGGDI